MISTNCPGKCQPEEVFNKAYWNFTKEDWQLWAKSFLDFSVLEYEEHIKQVIDMYLPKNIYLNFRKEEK